MANAYLNLANTTRLQTVLRRAKSLSRIPTGSSGANFFGSNAADRDYELIEAVNDAVRDIVDEFPMFNVSTTTLTTTADQRYVELPATMRFSDIIAIRWDEDTDSRDKLNIRGISRTEVDHLPREYRQDNYTQDFAEYWCMREGMVTAAIDLFPMPSGEKDFTLIYRISETPFTVKDLAVLTPTVVGGIVTAITVDYGGRGFTSVPTLSISGGSGSGATATATLSGGQISAVAVTAGGTGYTSLPSVSFTGETTSPIPDLFNEVFCRRVGIKIVERNLGATSGELGALMGLYEQELARSRDRVIANLSMNGTNTHDFAGFTRMFEDMAAWDMTQGDW